MTRTAYPPGDSAPFRLRTPSPGFTALPDLLAFVARSARVDTIQLGIDLGTGYRRDSFVDSAQDEGASVDSPFVILRDTRAGRPSNPSGLIAAPERLEQRMLFAGTAGRRHAPRSGIALMRHPGRPAFKPGERRRISELLPQIDHAIALTHELECTRQRETCAFAMLEHAECGCLLLTPAGAPLHGNRLAFELLERARVHIGHRLRLPTPALQMHFDDALTRAATAGCADAPTLRVPGPPALLMHLHPARDGAHAPLTLILRGPRAVRLPDPVAQHFGLTPAEFRLCAALVEGQTLKTCAHDWNRSYDTLRSQLKTILAKTGTHRQAELIGLLNSFLA